MISLNVNQSTIHLETETKIFTQILTREVNIQTIYLSHFILTNFQRIMSTQRARSLFSIVTGIDLVNISVRIIEIKPSPILNILRSIQRNTIIYIDLIRQNIRTVNTFFDIKIFFKGKIRVINIVSSTLLDSVIFCIGHIGTIVHTGAQEMAQWKIEFIWIKTKIQLHFIHHTYSRIRLRYFAIDVQVNLQIIIKIIRRLKITFDQT